jgi:hypothetical protein
MILRESTLDCSTRATSSARVSLTGFHSHYPSSSASSRSAAMQPRCGLFFLKRGRVPIHIRSAELAQWFVPWSLSRAPRVRLPDPPMKTHPFFLFILQISLWAYFISSRALLLTSSEASPSGPSLAPMRVRPGFEPHPWPLATLFGYLFLCSNDKWVPHVSVLRCQRDSRFIVQSARAQ